MDHVSVKFGDPRCIGFSDIVRETRHTQKNGSKNPTPATAVEVGRYLVRF